MTTFSLKPSHSYIEKGRAWYDTKSGVASAIKTLTGLLLLCYERYQAAYVRKEELNQLYVLGNYYFDNCGNCLIAQTSIKENYPDIPDVLTHTEYWEFLKSKDGDEKLHGISFGYGQSIPSEVVTCPVCKKGWTIENVNDVVTRRTNETVELSNFIGKTLKEVKAFYGAKIDAHYFIGGEPFLNNDRFIDNSPWTLDPKTELEKTMVKNDNGWVGTKDGIDDNYVIEENDIVTFSVIHYFHKTCNRIDKEEKMLRSFQNIFKEAGYVEAQFISIANKYCSCDHCAPWFTVMTEIGPFQIGWRNSVININWSDLVVIHNSFEHLFYGEDVTKGVDFIHAHGEEKATEYLSKILDFCIG